MEPPFHKFKYSQRQAFGVPWTHKHHRGLGQPYHRMESSSCGSSSRLLPTMPMSSSSSPPMGR